MAHTVLAEVASNMAKIDIKYSSGKIVSTSGLGDAKPLDMSAAINLLGDVAKSDMDRIRAKEAVEQAAIDSNYNANTTVTLNNELLRLKEENKQLLFDDPDRYRQTVMGSLQPVFQRAIEGAPSEKARIAMQNQVANMTIHAGISTANDASEARAVIDRSNFNANIDSLSAQVLLHPESIEIAKLERAKLLEAFKLRARSPAEYVAVEQRTADTLDTVYLQGVANKDPDKALELAASGSYNHLGADNLEKIQYMAYQEKDARIKEAQKLEADRVAAMELDVKSRLSEARDVRSASKMVNEIIGRKKDLGKSYPELLNSAFSKYDHFNKKQEEGILVQSYISSGAKLDPSKKQHMQAAETAFDSIRDSYSKGNTTTKATILRSFLDKTGVLPSSVQRGLNEALNSGSSQEKVSAANTIAQLASDDPRFARHWIDNQQNLTLAQKISSNASFGMTPEEAVKSAEKDVFEGPGTWASADPRKQLLIKTFNTNKTQNPITEGDFSKHGFFSFQSDPDTIPEGMVAGAGEILRNLVLNEGVPYESAKKEAVRRTQLIWGQTTINGEKQWMKNAPENKYGVGSNDWMRPQLELDVKKDAVPGKYNVHISPLPIQLSKSGKQEYLVQHIDELGRAIPIVKKQTGKPMTWVPEYGSSPKAIAADMEYKKAIKSIRESANTKAMERLKNNERKVNLDSDPFNQFDDPYSDIQPVKLGE